MSRWHSYLNSAKEILLSYNGEEPFSGFIKKHFSANRKFGSSDRKQISHLCYCYFRSAAYHPDVQNDRDAAGMEEGLLQGLFLCSNGTNEILSRLRPAWNEKLDDPLEEKIKFLDFPLPALFPWSKELSRDIEQDKFTRSFLIQPDLFIRLRPGHEKSVIEKLWRADQPFSIVSATCLALPNASKLDELLQPDREVVVQDLNSQRIGELLTEIPRRPGQQRVSTWDCCAASGGKSILAVDLMGNIALTVSDARESILNNLKKRFARAGIQGYTSFTADLTQPDPIPGDKLFDLVLADVPCSGSGTWSRTPEQRYYFDHEKTDRYAALQQKIVSTVIPRIAPGGFLLYSTCSVFSKENEDNIAFIKEKFHLRELKMELFKGYDKKADTLFACLLQKSL